MQICADFLPALLHEYLGVSSSNFLCTRFFAVLVAAVPISPWVTVKKISGLESLSMLCLGLVLFVIAVLMANSIQCLVDHDVNSTVEISGTRLLLTPF